MVELFNLLGQALRLCIDLVDGAHLATDALEVEVVGVGLDPYSERDNFVLSGIGSKIKADIRADIRDGEKMKQIFAEYQPEIVFHLAAQPLVRHPHISVYV